VKRLDFISAIELAYAREADDAAWLEELTRFVAPAFSGGSPTTSYLFDLHEEDVQLGFAASVGEPPYSREHYASSHEVGHATTGRAKRVIYECEVFTLLSRVIGAGMTKRMIQAAGMSGDDALGLRANATPDSGVLVTTQVSAGFRIKNRTLWTRFAAHVGAALRLRRKRREPSPNTALAVLDPRGRLEHGTAETIAARHDLAGAAQDMDRARGKLRRLDPERASALWRTMVRGEWSLVDWFDHDGKRFLLAHDNQIPVTRRRSLSDRERQVVAHAAMSHSNKLIAYDLGLSTGTVAVILGRAAKKLGVSGRVALIRAFRENELQREGGHNE